MKLEIGDLVIYNDDNNIYVILPIRKTDDKGEFYSLYITSETMFWANDGFSSLQEIEYKRLKSELIS